jgi:hypothetical protein
MAILQSGLAVRVMHDFVGFEPNSFQKRGSWSQGPRKRFSGIQHSQQGRLDDPTGNLFYAYPSIAVNQNNDAVVVVPQPIPVETPVTTTSLLFVIAFLLR